MTRTVFCWLALVGLGACGPVSTLGRTCSVGSTTCSAGLQCEVAGCGLLTQQGLCTKACQDAADCAGLATAPYEGRCSQLCGAPRCVLFDPSSGDGGAPSGP